MGKHLESHLDQQRKELESIVAQLREYLKFPQSLKRLEIASLETLLQGSEGLTELCAQAARGDRKATIKVALILGGSVLAVGLIVRKLFK